jgi:hypothetical protein
MIDQKLRTRKYQGLLLAAALLVAASTGLVYAQVGGGYDLSWNSVDGGGDTFSTGGTYTLGGTIGQPDAGQLSGGVYGLTGGFWGVAAPVLVGHVSWQGRTVGTNAFRAPVTITLKSGATEVNYAVQNTDASGYFTSSVGAISNGTYNWRVKGPKYLANAGTVSLTGASIVSQEMGLMRAGDCDNNNLVNVLDFNILKNTFGKGAGDPGYDDRADFDGNLLVSILDFNLQKGNFGTSGAPPLGPTGP